MQKYARKKLSLAGSMYNQQLFHKPNPKCHSPGIITPVRGSVLASDHRFGRIGDGSVVGKGSKFGSGGGILTVVSITLFDGPISQ